MLLAGNVETRCAAMEELVVLLDAGTRTDDPLRNS